MSDWYTERRQNQELEELRGEMSNAMSQASHLRSRLSQLQGGLESKLSRLATAFDAFVELSDVRQDLIGYADAAEVRRYAGQVLSALASGETLPVPRQDVPGYWLLPAVEALRALAAGDDEAGPLAEATARDDRRTAIFLCLSLAALGQRNQVRAAWLDTAFGGLAADGTVTRVQRALWLAGARGGFGPDGLASMVKRLRPPGPADPQRWLAPVEARSTSARPVAPGFAELADQVGAQDRLGRLRTAVENITGDTAVLEPSQDLAYGAADQPDPDSAAALLRLLISEGSEPELESLARVAELRARITDPDGDQPGGGSVDDPVGALEDLLVADIGRADEPHLAAMALRVVSAGVVAGAEELARKATLPTPGTVTLKSERQQVTLRPDGPEPRSLAAAEGAIVATVAPLAAADLAVPVGVAVVGVLFGIGLGLVHWFWILVGAGIVADGARRYWAARTDKAQEREAAAGRAGRLREKAATGAAELAAYTKASAQRSSSISTDLATIRNRLTS